MPHQTLNYREIQIQGLLINTLTSNQKAVSLHHTRIVLTFRGSQWRA